MLQGVGDTNLVPKLGIMHTLWSWKELSLAIRFLVPGFEVDKGKVMSLQILPHSTTCDGGIRSFFPPETDIKQKDKKKAKNIKAKHGMEKTKSNQGQSQSKSKSQQESQPRQSQKIAKSEENKLEWIKLPKPMLYYENNKTRAKLLYWIVKLTLGPVLPNPKSLYHKGEFAKRFV
ncbi:hypothetical protein Tco_0604214 [Tanacetum coccineum]